MASREGPDQIPMPTVSKPRYRLQALPGRAVGKCIRARRLLPLLLCLGWLWGATPVTAQDEASLPETEATGPFRNLAENHAGTFHLTREEGVVYATFQSVRSPVQSLAQDQPEVLFTVPEGFRPVLPMTWEVSAEPVLPDGTSHPDRPDRHVFRMRVDRKGHVRYVDDAGVDGVGHLRYHTMLAWPLAGTEPRVCDRYWRIREGLLAAVQALDDAALPCSLVDWTHLARIQTLSLFLPIPLAADSERHVLLGLTNLTTLQVQSWNGRTVPEVNHLTKLLAHTPRLQTLRIDGDSWNVSADLLRYTPLLVQLSIRNNPHQELDLPGELLAHTPHLKALHVEGRHPSAGLVQLLAHAPRLARLTVMPSTPLPETFLATVPQLTHLTVGDGLEPCDTPQLLASVPRLRHVAVRMNADAQALDCLADSLRRYAPGLDRLEIELHDLQDLNAGMLPSLPRLSHLTLDVVGLTSLPEPLLAQVPELTHLTLQGSNTTLPAGFLVHTPGLTALSLQIDHLHNLPFDLLAPVPGLRQLQIDTSRISLPAGFLDPVPQLIELRMEGSWTNLPADFLMHAPHLEALHLNAHFQESLPANFLTHAPRLAELHLRVPVPEILPSAFLAHAPRLEVLHLDAEALKSLPEGFLTHVPRLVELRLYVPELRTLPTAFLVHAPRLEKLELAYSAYEYSYSNSNVLGLVKHVTPITSLPVHFLSRAPRLRSLNLQSGLVAEFPPGFLAQSPQLRHLNLDANGVTALPTDFLAHHPRLETVRLQARHIPVLPPGFLAQSPNLISLKLDLQQVEALPESLLTQATRLHEVELGVNRVETLPAGFLARVPHLAHLQLRALSLAVLPTGFLAHAPRVRTLGLALPLLEPTLKPSHRLWDLLQTTSTRVKVTRPNPVYFTIHHGDPHPCPLAVKAVVFGDILEVRERERDDHGHMLLRVRHWQNHELLVTYTGRNCPFLIDARSTEPTLEVCEVDRNPAECVPVRDHYHYPKPLEPVPFRG